MLDRMRILLADDHDLVREALAFTLRERLGAEVETFGTVAELDRRLEAGREAGQEDLALILSDLRMPGMDGMTGFAALVTRAAPVPVALLSGEAGSVVAAEAVALGARGFVPKSLGLSSMLAAIGLMIGGDVYLPYDWMMRARERQAEMIASLGLSPREVEVLALLAEGHSNKVIAARLDLQEVTVKVHVSSLLRKLGVTNRTQAGLMWRDLEKER
ncbi:response regulator [Aquicoccus sp. SCR17]|nr:response regulator [Carideicomes alvinocaridis]